MFSMQVSMSAWNMVSVLLFSISVSHAFKNSVRVRARVRIRIRIRDNVK